MNTLHAPNAERSVLGALILKNDVYDLVADILKPDHFHDIEHRKFYTAIRKLAANGTPFDAVTLSDYLGGNYLSTLGGIANSTPSTANAVAYAKLVRDKAVKRQVITIADKIRKQAMAGDTDAVSLIDAATNALMEISETDKSDGPVSICSCLSDVVDTLDQRYQQGESIIGISSGFIDLDQLTAGFQPGDLAIVAARPSMGKTTLAMNFAEAATIRQKLSVLVFSMEQPRSQLTERMLSSLGHIKLSQIKSGQLDDDAWQRLTSAVSLLDSAKLQIDDSAALTVSEVRTRSRRVSRQHGLDLVIVDYIQLMQGKGQNRTQEVGQISAGLKALAKELRVPVIALSQLNRGPTQRPDKRPVMSDLRDSGNLEQDADLILFIHRDDEHQEVAELNLAKHRNGPTGKILLTFRGMFVRFENYSGPMIDLSPPRKAPQDGFNYRSPYAE